MTASEPRGGENEEFWRDFLTRGHSKERAVRRIFKVLPHDPRCRLCAAPFSGSGAPLMRLIGKRRSDKSPNFCSSCFTFMKRNHGGAEIECTFLFADVRGSTTLAENMSPGAFRALMDRFYDVAAAVVFEHDGVVDKFVGDELVAMFFPLFAGPRHSGRAVETASALLHATGHAEPRGPWLPLGAGVHAGTAWVGAVGTGAHTEFTALGDTVNTTARLAAAAKAGEILVTAEAATAAGLEPTLERRRLELRGKEHGTEIVTLAVGPGAAPG